MKKTVRLVSFLVVAGVVCALVGCGGGGGIAPPPSTGGSGISVTIIWPERNGQRLIPGPCDSVRVILLDPATGQKATQPASYAYDDFQELIPRGTTTAQFLGLPMGVDYIVRAVAYDQDNGLGVQLADGNSITITTPTTPDTTNGASVTIATVIDRVAVAPSSTNLTIPPGSVSIPYQRQFSGAAWDDGSNPLYDPWNTSPVTAPTTIPVQGFNWGSSDTGVCTVNATGLASAVLRATSATATVTATEQQTLIQGTTTVNVGVSGYDVIVQ